MRKILLALFLTVAFGAFLHIEAHATQTVTVQVNHQKTLAKSKLTIKFLSLVEDSRCPTDVQCIQAGNAKITIQIKKAGGTWETFEVNTNFKPQAVLFAGYIINLTDLNPKPASNIRINRNGYKAAFSVGKMGKMVLEPKQNIY